jgi:hypothetical protein
VAQPGDVNPQTGQPVQAGSTLVDIYCNGTNVSTTVVPPGGAAPPPAPAEVAALTPFPAETIHINPCGLGLTGLTSWFWVAVGPGAGSAVPPIAATATIRGYTVHVTASPVSYRWDIKGVTRPDIYATLWGTKGGSVSYPSVSWMPETKGFYTVTLTVAWSGQYSFTGNGISQSSALGPVDQAPQTRQMGVQEIRSVLVSPDATTTTPPPAPPRDLSTC